MNGKGINNKEVFVDVSKDLTGLMLGIIALTLVFLTLFIGVNSYKVQEKPKVFKDKKTGCEYLYSSFGITPRLDGTWQQYGCVDAKSNLIANNEIRDLRRPAR